jgi:hypothetical protein
MEPLTVGARQDPIHGAQPGQHVHAPPHERMNPRTSRRNLLSGRSRAFIALIVMKAIFVL